METIQEWFTAESLLTLAGATIAIRVMVEYTKEDFDAAWRRITGHHPRTRLYAQGWSYVLIFGLHALLGKLTPLTAFVDIFNGVLLTVVAGVLEKPKTPAEPK